MGPVRAGPDSDRASASPTPPAALLGFHASPRRVATSSQADAVPQDHCLPRRLQVVDGDLEQHGGKGEVLHGLWPHPVDSTDTDVTWIVTAEPQQLLDL